VTFGPIIVLKRRTRFRRTLTKLENSQSKKGGSMVVLTPSSLSLADETHPHIRPGRGKDRQKQKRERERKLKERSKLRSMEGTETARDTSNEDTGRYARQIMRSYQRG